MREAFRRAAIVVTCLLMILACQIVWVLVINPVFSVQRHGIVKDGDAPAFGMFYTIATALVSIRVAKRLLRRRSGEESES